MPLLQSRHFGLSLPQIQRKSDRLATILSTEDSFCIRDRPLGADWCKGIASYAEFADNVIVKLGIKIWYFKAVALQQRETETSFAFITYVGLLIRYF